MYITQATNRLNAKKRIQFMSQLSPSRALSVTYSLPKGIGLRSLHPHEPLMFQCTMLNPVPISRNHSPERCWKLRQIHLLLFTRKSTYVLGGNRTPSVDHSNMIFTSAYIQNTEYHMFHKNDNFSKKVRTSFGVKPPKSSGVADSERI